MNNEPAFPISASEYGGHGSEAGMTLRDYFAAKAMQGRLTLNALVDCQDMAVFAYKIADAMLAERVKNNEQ